MKRKSVFAIVLTVLFMITVYTHAQTVVNPQITTYDVEWNPTGTRIATANPGGLIRIWDNSGVLLQEIQAHPDRVRSIAWKPDGTQLASAGSDAYVHIWDTASWTEVVSFVAHSGEGIIEVDWSNDGSQLVSLGVNEVIFWDTTHWQQIDGFRASATDIDWSIGDQLDIVVLPSIVAIWDATATTFQYTLIDPDSALLREASRSPDGTRIVEGNAVGTIRLWDVATQTDLGVLTELNNYIRDLVYSPDGSRIAVALDSGIVHVLDASTGAILHTYSTNGPVLSVDWKPDSSEVAFVGVDGDSDSNNDLQIVPAPQSVSSFTLINADTNTEISPLNGTVQTDDIAHYEFTNWTPTPGTHTLTATPYSESGGAGVVEGSLTIGFTVVDGG